MSLVVIAAAVQLGLAAAMENSKLSAFLLLCMFSISSLSPILACGSCPPGNEPPTVPVLPPIVIKPPPVVVPPIIVHPPVVVPPVVKPPPVVVPPHPPVVPIIPPLLPPLVPIIPPLLPPLVPILPPLVPIIPPLLPPLVPVVPVVPAPKAGCPPPPAPVKPCPVDVVKFGACVDLLGGLVNVKAGDPAAQNCCPVISGLAEAEAALCLCTTLKLKLLNLNIYVPVALQLLVVCGKTPPPGYTCKA